MKKFIAYILILTAVLSFANCANMSKSPGGGPKDSIPPVVIGEIPANGAIGTSPKRVEVTFNEYVKIKDSKAFLVSPPLKSQPILKTRGKRVIVDIDSALNENTTYLFDFGSSIVDLNEGNPLGDYRLAFSTGNVVDSMHISGRTCDAFTLDSIKDLKVLLYLNDIDSLPFTTNPDALSRVSNRGYFVAEALQNKPYRIIALEDKNQNNRYDAEEMVGFLDEMQTPLTFLADTMSVGDYDRDTIHTFSKLPLVRLFSENIKKQYLSEYNRSEERKVVLYFSKHNPQINYIHFVDADSVALDSSKIIIEKSYMGDTITYWFANDSVPAKLRANISYIKPDSTGVDAPFETMLKFKDFVNPDLKKKKKKDDDIEKKKTIALSARLDEKLVMENGFDLIFGAPLMRMDSTKINFYQYSDDGQTINKIPFKITRGDNLCKYNIQAAKWESGTRYEVEFNAGSFVDIYRLENDSVRQKMQTPNPDKFSILKFEIANAKCNYIVQLMKDRKTVVQSKQMQGNGVITFSFIEPGVYMIRVIEDANNNGRWDTGSLMQRKQPERVKFYTLENGENKLKLKQGWETEQKIDVSTFFEN